MSELRDALAELRAAFPVDDVSDGPWVVEEGKIAWMVREGEGGPQIGNFILEADARFVAATRAALAAQPESAGLDVERLAASMAVAWPTSFRGYETESEPAKNMLRQYAAVMAREYARLTAEGGTE